MVLIGLAPIRDGEIFDGDVLMISSRGPPFYYDDALSRISSGAPVFYYDDALSRMLSRAPPFHDDALSRMLSRAHGSYEAQSFSRVSSRVPRPSRLVLPEVSSIDASV